MVVFGGAENMWLVKALSGPPGLELSRATFFGDAEAHVFGFSAERIIPGSPEESSQGRAADTNSWVVLQAQTGWAHRTFDRHRLFNHQATETKK